MDADVIVVGAGPAGCATAWALAREGVDVLMLDRAHFPRDKVCSEYLSPEASRILDAMGALTLCEQAGAAQLHGMTVRAPNGARVRGDFAGAHGYRGYRDRGLALRRVVLDSILVERARASGVRVEEGVRVTDLVRDGRGTVCGVRTLLPDGSTRDRQARLVVGADGLRSVIARRLGLTRVARYPRRLAIVAHYRGVSGMTSYGEMYVERDGYGGFANVGNGITNVAVVVPMKRAREAQRDLGAFMTGWLSRRPYLAARLEGAERLGPARATGPFASRSKRAWAPGVALVGDAADFYDPFTGEGIFAALRGGEILAEHARAMLGANGTRQADAALAAYDRRRRELFGGKWIVERMVGAAIAFTPLMNRAAATLARRKDMADLLVGVAGDFVPPRAVLTPSFIFTLFASPSGS
ncbi:MAG TPA: NAD(P)/FAD-dependent oxidoreductase [Gemmatimonadaceae bacterium]|nr:NAD(P)/FAD-dependent oxidoreductase [Gemmatimonadaceae bacterium]